MINVTITTAKRKSGYKAKVAYSGIGIVDTKYTGYETKEAAVNAAKKGIKAKSDHTIGGSDWQIAVKAGK